MSVTKAVTVDLGEEQTTLERYLASGEYGSADEVLREGLRALEREHIVDDEVLRTMIDEAVNDPRPDVPAEEVFARLEKRFPLPSVR